MSAGSAPLSEPVLTRLALASGQYAYAKSQRLRLAIDAAEQGYSWSEIGAALGMTEAGARQLVNRAKKGGEK